MAKEKIKIVNTKKRKNNTDIITTFVVGDNSRFGKKSYYYSNNGEVVSIGTKLHHHTIPPKNRSNFMTQHTMDGNTRDVLTSKPISINPYENGMSGFTRKKVLLEDVEDIDSMKMNLEGTLLPPSYHSEVIDLINYYKNGSSSYRWEPPKSCSDCGGGIGFDGCSGVCVDAKAKKDKWKFTISWTF